MADIRTILRELNAPHPHADKEALRVIKTYPGTKVRWEKNKTLRLIDQLNAMAVFVGQFSNSLHQIKDHVAARVIDHFRVQVGWTTMEDFLGTSEAPGKLTPVDGLYSPYSGSHVWAKLIIESLEVDYDNEAADIFLSAVNDQELHEKLKARIKQIVENRYGIQDLGIAIASLLRTCSPTFPRWKLIKPAQQAYVIRRVVNHFITELTEGTVSLMTLLQWAIKDEPALQGYIPLGVSSKIHTLLLTSLTSTTLIPTTTDTMSDLSHYSSTPVARPTLVYGEDIDLMDDEELIDATKAIQARIDKLRLVPGNSRKIARQITEAEEALKLVVAKLDADLPSE